MRTWSLDLLQRLTIDQRIAMAETVDLGTREVSPKVIPELPRMFIRGSLKGIFPTAFRGETGYVPGRWQDVLGPI